LEALKNSNTRLLTGERKLTRNFTYF